MKRILILALLSSVILGCKTYEIDSVHKKADNSMLLKSGAYKTYKLESRREVDIYKAPTSAIGRFSTQSTPEKHTRLSKEYKETYEEAIMDMFGGVGLIRDDENYDLILQYFILFRSSTVGELKSETFGVYNLKGMDASSNDLLFEVTGKAESGYAMNKTRTKEICSDIFSELELFDNVQ